MIKKICVSMIFLMRFLSAQQLPSIAVLDLDAKGIAAEEASVLTDKLRGELFQTGQFQVIERSVMNDILKEQGFQQTGCTSKECAVEVGQLIGVQYIVAGSIGKIEKTYLLSVRLINVATGKIEKSVQKEHSGTLTDVLKDGIPSVVKELTKPLSKTDTKAYDTPDELQKPVAKHIKKGFFRRGSTVISLSYSKSTGVSEFVNTSSSPAVKDEITRQTNGFYIGAGKRINNHYLGLAFTYHGSEKEVLANNGHILERDLWGINADYYFERLKIRDIFLIAPGIAFGYWRLSDHAQYSGEPLKSASFPFNILGGPQGRMELGWKRIHLFVSYTLLIAIGENGINPVEWIKAGESPYYEGTYSAGRTLHSLNFGVSVQFF